MAAAIVRHCSECGASGNVLAAMREWYARRRLGKAGDGRRRYGVVR